MLLQLTTPDFDALLTGVAPGTLRLSTDSALAPPEVLEMLNRLAAEIGAAFSPSAWLMVEDEEIVGLCSIVRPPRDGDLHIGYGVVPSRQGRGCATRAIGDLVTWARADPRVLAISAETGVENIASQLVLERNGFIRSGERIDPEDGPLIGWRIITA